MSRSKNIKKENKHLKKYPLVMVQWNDAQSDAEWGEIPDIKKWAKEKYIVDDVGWVIIDNDSHIVISSQVGSDGSVGNRTNIPNQWIISRKAIKL